METVRFYPPSYKRSLVLCTYFVLKKEKTLLGVFLEKKVLKYFFISFKWSSLLEEFSLTLQSVHIKTHLIYFLRKIGNFPFYRVAVGNHWIINFPRKYILKKFVCENCFLENEQKIFVEFLPARFKREECTPLEVQNIFKIILAWR
jgi:hypothetical protein